jgi:sugar phosphate isomerase/epimerase
MQTTNDYRPASEVIEMLDDLAAELETGDEIELWPNDVYQPGAAYIAELRAEAGKRGLTLDVGPYGGWLTRPE